MEDICNRFPSLIKMVCINFDNQTLMKSKEANQALTNERLIWIRIIKKHCNSFKGFEEAWSKVVSKAPIDIVRKIAMTLEKYGKEKFSCNMAPLHIAAREGSIELYNFVNAQTDVKNPADENGWTPLHRSWPCARLIGS